jgi:hypothetical protein
MRDIRRTVATGLAELGTSPTVISKVLDHTLPGGSTVTPISSRYAFLGEKRQALDSWGRPPGGPPAIEAARGERRSPCPYVSGIRGFEYCAYCDGCG